MSSRLWNIIGTVFVLVVLSGCSSSPPVRSIQEDIRATIEDLKLDGAEVQLGPELRSVEETLALAERFLAEQDTAEGERYLKLARLKANLLQRNYFDLKVRKEEERLALERKELERIEEERRKAAVEKEKEEVRRQAERAKKEKERLLPATHTVKRGETLPQIAALPDIYNDSTLWPLLYRANRDQIRDPNIIWPGQVLLITRNLSHEDIVEAKKYALERPIH